MNIPELIYKLNVFYFTNLWNFCELLILIMVLRGDVKRGVDGVKKYFKDIKVRYKAKIARDGLIEKAKTILPLDVKRVQKINLENHGD
jgi:hypothetical protein